jgi:endonuclease-8
MPEGPTLIITSEQARVFVGKTVRRAEGNSKLIDPQRMVGRKLLEIRTWGKHLLLRFSGFSLRVHFMLFGSYRINERKDSKPRLSLGFGNGEFNLYGCSVKYIEGDLDQVYDWSGDVLSPHWDAAAARAKLRQQPDLLCCDALLDQSIFAGVGNIIKNEVLFRIRLHPLSTVAALPARKLAQMVREAREYSFDFLAWRRLFVLKKHLLVHNRASCPRCELKLVRAHLGRTHRRAFYSENCQVLHAGR